MSDLDPTRAKWPQIAALLADRIERGQYAPGFLLSSRAVETEFEVAKVTAAKVLAELRRRRLVRTEFGLGSYVTTPAERGDE